MATEHRVLISNEVWGRLEAKAEAEGKTIDELADEALRDGLEERSWNEILAYGRERGRASGITEDLVPEVIHEWRREHSGR